MFFNKLKEYVHLSIAQFALCERYHFLGTGGRLSRPKIAKGGQGYLPPPRNFVGLLSAPSRLLSSLRSVFLGFLLCPFPSHVCPTPTSNVPAALVRVLYIPDIGVQHAQTPKDPVQTVLPSTLHFARGHPPRSNLTTSMAVRRKM